MSFQAYKKWEKVHGSEPLLPGVNMTHDQLFFLNFAQIWCGNMRDKAALEKIRTSAHSPGPIRCHKIKTCSQTNTSRFFNDS